ncbi:MAG: glycerol-3-phosphate dehydrogenase/oxidase [Bacteroidales bacterium]|nr:glycerol-3-phosphate dehydrogenase/oxidase [Bacteroidales bacterium]
MKRDHLIKQLKDNQQPWDVVVIGGGASGLGTALEAATRGYRTVLLEMADFSKGTSSRSTKLVHGGVRYLAQGDVSLVMEALRERGLLRKNAPHLVKNQSFIIPNYEWWGGPFYTIGLKIYDMMAGRLSLGSSVHVSREKTLKFLPNLRREGLRGGVVYHDGQFDDSRLAVNMAQTIVDYDGIVLNYCKVTDLLKDEQGKVNGVKAADMEGGGEYAIPARSVVNATGVFADDILKMDEPGSPKRIMPSQGIHIVLDKTFLRSDYAIMIPKTNDGRVLFAVPWRGKVVVGTTDTKVDHPSLEPEALEEEIEFVLNTAGDYLDKAPKRSDVKSIFAGLRPLAAPQGAGKSTKEISRGHKVMVSSSGLVTLTGGKWTTYRKMGEDTVDRAIKVSGLEKKASKTKNLPIHGYLENVNRSNHLYVYGSDRKAIEELMEQEPELTERLDERLDFTKAEVVWAVRNEMARTVDDVLARRVRALPLDARAAVDMAPEVARILARELGKDEQWQKEQVESFTSLANGYYLEDK